MKRLPPRGKGGPKGRMRGEASVAAREWEAVAGLPPHQSPSATASPSGEASYLYKTGA